MTNNRVVRNYADNAVGYSIKCAINKPTRIFNNLKTLLDHIYTNCCYLSAISGIALSDISHHFPTFIYLPDREIKKELTETFYIRDTSNFSLNNAFCEDLKANLNNLLISETRLTHAQFEEFIHLFTDIVNAHAPHRRATRKEKQLKKTLVDLRIVEIN